jgi:3-hydroxyisobutyrate dehydrogenase-like beta-hydroxyacid dehydrogenase
MAKVGFIGLGRMGHGMIARGARWAASPADAADGADAVITMVADDEASRSVWLGKDGAAIRMKPGAFAVECSTVSHQHALDMARELRGRGLVYIDCPVTGLPSAAAAGKLTLLVGAEPTDLDHARPYLAPIGDVVRHFGAVGTGTVYKLINNLMGAVQIASLAEGVAMAEQAGLDMNLVAEAMATGAVASPQVIRHSKRMVARDFSGASFTAALRHKDAAYAVKLAESLLADPPPLGRAAVEAYARAKAEMPDDDEGRMIEIVSRPK